MWPRAYWRFCNVKIVPLLSADSQLLLLNVATFTHAVDIAVIRKLDTNRFDSMCRNEILKLAKSIDQPTIFIKPEVFFCWKTNRVVTEWNSYVSETVLVQLSPIYIFTHSFPKILFNINFQSILVSHTCSSFEVSRFFLFNFSGLKLPSVRRHI